MWIEEEIPPQSRLRKMGRESHEEWGEIEGVTRMTRLLFPFSYTHEFQFKDVKDAAERIRGKVKTTPLEVCTILTNFYSMIQCADILSHH